MVVSREDPDGVELNLLCSLARRLPPRAGSARGGGDGDQGSDAGPDARMISWKATGGLLCEHAPPDRAPISRMLIR